MFRIGENLLVRIGEVKRSQNVLSEFCEIRWAASSSSEVSQMAQEIFKKLSLPSNAVQIVSNFSKIQPTVPYCNRHLAVLLVKFYEELANERGLT